MSVGPPSICLACKHLRSASTCAAYPARIPRAILFQHYDHRTPFAGDGGIRFETATGKQHLVEAFDHVERLIADRGEERYLLAASTTSAAMS